MANSGQGGIFDQSANALQGAGAAAQSAIAGPNLAQFQNPYTSQVTDATMADLERQRLMQQNAIGAQAGAGGAFGGSRHGVADALTNEAFARQGASMFADLNREGFNTALGAAQNQQGIELQGAGALGQLGQTGFNIGSDINQQQAASGAMQQGLQQAIIDAARGQFAGFTGAPEQALNLPLAAIGAVPQGGGGTTTQQSQPGLLNYLSLGLGLL